MTCDQNNTEILIVNKIIKTLPTGTDLSEIYVSNFHHLNQILVIRMRELSCRLPTNCVTLSTLNLLKKESGSVDQTSAKKLLTDETWQMLNSND